MQDTGKGNIPGRHSSRNSLDPADKGKGKNLKRTQGVRSAAYAAIFSEGGCLSLGVTSRRWLSALLCPAAIPGHDDSSEEWTKPRRNGITNIDGVSHQELHICPPHLVCFKYALRLEAAHAQSGWGLNLTQHSFTHLIPVLHRNFYPLKTKSSLGKTKTKNNSSPSRKMLNALNTRKQAITCDIPCDVRQCRPQPHSHSRGLAVGESAAHIMTPQIMPPQ
ncbi:hypothetical protein M434DRAFT_34989 [Hypoxylon sp. CO27-5]|nr:hypothetical protein M434DRAFT_34989 [Hypoxylon sp. CO27-5]